MRTPSPSAGRGAPIPGKSARRCNSAHRISPQRQGRLRERGSQVSHPDRRSQTARRSRAPRSAPQSCKGVIPMLAGFVQWDAFAAGDCSPGFIDRRPRPAKVRRGIVRLQLGNRRAQGRFDRGEAPRRNLPREPCVIGRREGDAHKHIFSRTDVRCLPPARGLISMGDLGREPGRASADAARPCRRHQICGWRTLSSPKHH